jgi:O-antigen/teichoic acid export membrane protein
VVNGNRGQHRRNGHPTRAGTLFPKRGPQSAGGPQHAGIRRPHRHRRKESLGGKASRAFGLNFIMTIMTKLSMFGIGVVIARQVGPLGFGVYAVAYVAMTAMTTFDELGVTLAIVRWEDNPRRIIPTVSAISVSFSALIYVCFFLAASSFTRAMGVPAATLVVRILASCVLIDGLTNVPVAVLQRNFQQGKLTIAHQVNTWLGIGVTLVLALTGHGAMSLAIGRLAGNFASMILLLIFVPDSLRLGFDRVLARSLLRFGTPLAGANLLLFAVTTVDQVIVGHVLGAAALGFYVLASNLSSWPITVFSTPVRNVAPALFSRLQQDPARMRQSFLSVAGLLAATALPVCFVIGASARPLIGYVYGPRWHPAAEALIGLSIIAAARIFFELSYDYLSVLAKSRLLLIVQLVWLAGLIPAMVAGARIAGIYGASMAAAVVACVLVLPCYILALRATGVGPAGLARHLLFPVIGGGLTWLACREAVKLAPSDLTALALSGVLTLCILGLLLYWMRPAIKALRVATTWPTEESTSSMFPASVRADRAPSGDSVDERIRLGSHRKFAYQYEDTKA